MRMRTLTMCCLAALFGGAAAGPLLAAPFEHPALASTTATMPLDQALNAFAQREHLQLVYPSQIAKGVRVQDVPAGLSPDVTLRRLLEGTGLHYRFLNAKTVTIFAAPAGDSPAAASSVNHTGDKSAPKPQTTTLTAITVTAQKRTENVRNVPSSISVVSSEQLDNRHVTSLADLSGALPGVQIDTGGGPGLATISMRGISSLGGTGSVVGTYIDDAPLGSSANFAQASFFALDLLPYDIERIEVLRGPQGTLYGAGALGGLVKYVTIPPDLSNFSGRVGGGVSTISGAHGTGWDGRAAVNLPIIADRLAITASVAQNKTPGYVDNVQTGQQGINGVTQRSARVSLLWQPSDDLSLKISALHQSVNANDKALIALNPITEQPLYGDQKTAKGLAEPFSKRVNFYAATLKWNLQWADFVSATSYSTYRTHDIVNESAAFGPLFPVFGAYPPGLSAYKIDLGLKKFTQEFRLASKPGGDIEWLLGAFYTREISKEHEDLTAQSNGGASVPGLDPLFILRIPTTYKEGALFGDLTYKFSDRFDVTGGLRYARNEQNYAQQVPAGKLLALGTTPGKSAEDVLTWMLSPRYHLNDDSMLYLRAASGYRAGGPNLALPGVPPSVKSDKLVSYEAGWKSLFLDSRASIDLAGYDIHWRGIQLIALTPQGIGYVANGGTARSSGVELNTAFLPVHDLRLGLNAAYAAKARLTEDAPSLQGKDGDRLPNVPRWNASFTTDYYFRLPDAWSGHVGGSYRWIGQRLSNVSSNPFAYREGSYGVLDFDADVAKDVWTIRFYAKNLTNKHPRLNITDQQNALTGAVASLQSAVLQPRTVGIEIDMQF